MSNSSSKVIVAALAGAAIGAVAGLLFAPEKGEDLRKRIAQKGSEAKDGVMSKVEDGLSSLKDLKNNILSSADGVANEANDRLAKLKNV